MTKSFRARASIIFCAVLLLDSLVPCGKIGITLFRNYLGDFTIYAFYIRIAVSDRGAFSFFHTFVIT